MIGSSGYMIVSIAPYYTLFREFQLSYNLEVYVTCSHLYMKWLKFY